MIPHVDLLLQLLHNNNNNNYNNNTGPATWSLDMAEMYPNSTFHGVDAYPVYPSEVKPQNCHFQPANVAEKLPFPDNHFDFIYQRLLIFGFTRTDWKNVRGTSFLFFSLFDD